MLISKQNNNINFTSTPLYPVSIKKVSKDGIIGLEKAVFSKLNHSDGIDKAAVRELATLMEEKDYSGKYFCASFQDEDPGIFDYYAIEKKEGTTLFNKLIGIAKAFKDGSDYHMSFLFVKPEYRKTNLDRELEDVGKSMMGLIFNEAKAQGAKRVTFDSYQDKFYLRILEDAKIQLNQGKSFSDGYGLPEGSSRFNIDKSDFDKYLNHMKTEHGVDFSRVIRNGIEI